MKNWWYYHKWYVAGGIILFAIICNLAGHALGLWTKKADFQIAYIGQTELPEDAVSSLEQAFASVSSDFNQDGEVIVSINQYIFDSQSSVPETASFGYASEITLIGDISNCDSYFFLMDDPEWFQQNYHLLASPDGSCPEKTDNSIADKTILWSECPALSQMELGSYSVNISGTETKGDIQELLSGLHFGRRCFYTEQMTTHSDECNKLWNSLVSSS